MLVSIISSVYNGEKYLEEFFVSIIKQSYTDWELLIINDGSTDESQRIIDEWAQKDERIKPYIQQNRGLSVARNVGLKNCNGDFIVFVDSDDYIDTDYLKIFMQKQQDSDADVVVCNFYKVYVDEVVADLRMPKEEKVLTSRDMLKALYIYPACYAVVWNRLYRRIVFDNLQFTEGIINEDSDIMPRLFEKEWRVLYIPERLYYYRRRGSGITGNMTEKLAMSGNAWLERHIEWYELHQDAELLEMATKLLVYFLAENYKYFTNENLTKVRTSLRRYGKILLKSKRFQLKIKTKLYVMVFFPYLYSRMYNRKVKSKHIFFE